MIWVCRFVFGLGFCMGIFVLSHGCSSKGDSDSTEDKASAEESETRADTNGETSEAGILAVSDNLLLATYPQGLTISSFPETIDGDTGAVAAGTVAVSTSLALQDLPSPNGGPLEPPPDGVGSDGGAVEDGRGENFRPSARHPKAKAAEDAERLKGAAEDCFSEDIIYALAQKNPGDTEVCFGFDYGIISGSTMGTLPAGRINHVVGLIPEEGGTTLEEIQSAFKNDEQFTATVRSEACMVYVGRSLVEEAVGQLEGALQVFQGMLCQAKKDGKSKTLEVGETLDLKDVLSKYKRASVTAASVARLDDVDGRKVFKSTINLTPNGGPIEGQAIAVTMVHSPADDSNTEYDGVMSYQGTTKNPPGSTTGDWIDVTTINYSKIGTTADDQNLKYEVRKARFNRDKVSGFITEDGIIDYNVGVDVNGSYGAGNPRDYATGFGYFAFDVNPSTYAGTISFWSNPGGSYTEAARGFVFKTTQQDDGTLAGCAFSGAARDYSIRKAQRVGVTLEPTGCYTPQISRGACRDPATQGSGNGGAFGFEIWKQCFRQKIDGLYVVDLDNIEDHVNGFDILSPNDAGLPPPPKAPAAKDTSVGGRGGPAPQP